MACSLKGGGAANGDRDDPALRCVRFLVCDVMYRVLFMCLISAFLRLFCLLS
jgi:hypothetical protein